MSCLTNIAHCLEKCIIGIKDFSPILVLLQYRTPKVLLIFNAISETTAGLIPGSLDTW